MNGLFFCPKKSKFRVSKTALMKISKKSLRILVIVMVVVWLGAGTFFVLTSITAKPVEITLAGIEKFSRNDLKHCLLLEKDQVIYIHEDEKIK